MHLTLDLPDQHYASFLEHLRTIPYVIVIPPKTKTANKKKSSSPAASPEKAEVLDGIRNAVKELNEVLAGRKQAKTFDEFFTELQSEVQCNSD